MFLNLLGLNLVNNHLFKNYFIRQLFYLFCPPPFIILFITFTHLFFPNYLFIKEQDPNLNFVAFYFSNHFLNYYNHSRNSYFNHLANQL